MTSKTLEVLKINQEYYKLATRLHNKTRRLRIPWQYFWYPTHSSNLARISTKEVGVQAVQAADKKTASQQECQQSKQSITKHQMPYRRHVVWSSNKCPGKAAAVCQHPGQTKVAQFHIVFHIKKHICGLQIPVKNGTSIPTLVTLFQG